ncbi:hypothetical protein BDV25DRAFT_157324 [Aspergillus avenaceus]|uniref:Uncharacterized protein n=1 Tax=Aspergillus avenaceus TaxID=36643 RepID=A0A5N6TRF7_ASPAV|nr:hypothetical protein BDV25DRAFT_157324 [Aspergillus avenaceus]
MTNFMRHRSLLTGALTIVAVSSAIVYLTKRRLNQSCPRVSITDLPKPSACRNLLDTTWEVTTPTPWGLTKSTLLSSWSGRDKTHWVSSFVALQAEVPISQLAEYGAFSCDNGSNNNKSDARHLMQNLVAAFLDARATGPETWFLDRAVPPLSFEPSTHLFGRSKTMGAFMLATWDSGQGISVKLSDLPSGATKPVTEFCSNEGFTRDAGSTDIAGAVIYWRFPDGLVGAVDKAVSYGLPWRLMQGGFQEFIVEKVSDEKARVTYVCVECTDLHPGGQHERDFKMLPWLFYEAHVLYAQVLWSKTLKQLERSQSVTLI